VIVSNNSGATEPGTMYAYQWWADTTTGLLKIRNAANNAWVTLRELDGTLTLEDGTAAAPGLAFTSDLNTGLFRVGADQVAISTGGTSRLAVSTTAVSSTLPVDVPLGAVGTPSLTFTGDLNTGLFSSGADAIDIATAGTRRFGVSSAGELTVYGGNLTLNGQGDLRLADSDSSNYVALQAPTTVASNVTFTLPSADGTNGQVLTTNGTGTLSFTAGGGASNLADGTAATPSVNFSSDTDTGVFRAGANRLAFATNGASVGEFDGSNLKFNSGYGSVATAYGCRAWVNFNGTGTVAIRASGNVSSITDNGTGDYTVNFTTAMVDANGSLVGITWRNTTSTPDYSMQSQMYQSSTTTARVVCYDSANNKEDHAFINVAIFR